MPALIDLTSQKFGRLLVLELTTHRNKGGGRYWLCQCECSSIVEVTGQGLRSQHTRSCGCLGRDNPLKQKPKTHGKRYSKFYARYLGMMDRCNNPKNKCYKDYGGRGITVCDEWRYHPAVFIKWCEEQEPVPKGSSLDRRENNGPYAPWNCEFKTQSQQMRNTRCNVIVDVNGHPRKLIEIWEESNKLISYSQLYHRVHTLKWALDIALGLPIQSGGTSPNMVRQRNNSGKFLKKGEYIV